MNSKEKTPTWDSILSIFICGLIAVIVICIAVQWLQRPLFVEKVVSDYNSMVSESYTDLSASDEMDESDTSEVIEISSSDTTSTETAEVLTTTTKLEEKKQYLIITVQSAVVRKSNTVNSDKITSIPQGKKVEMLEKKGKWYKIEYMDKVGWIHRNCVEVCEE